MNSSRHGPVRGFKLQSLDKILDIKSIDKKQTLLHYIVKTITNKFPEFPASLELELTFLDKAIKFSLESLQFQMNETEKELQNARKEYEVGLESKNDSIILKVFLAKAEVQFKELQKNYKISQEHFNSSVEYFGEAPRIYSPVRFFSIFVRFLKGFNQAKLENNMRMKLQESRNKYSSPKISAKTVNGSIVVN